MFTFCMEQCKLIRTRLIFFILSIDGCFFWSHAHTCASLSLFVSDNILPSVGLNVKIFFLFQYDFQPLLRVCVCWTCDFAVVIHVYDFWIEIFVGHLYGPFRRWCYSHSFLCAIHTHYLYSKSVSNFYVHHHFHQHEMALVLCILNECWPLLFSQHRLALRPQWNHFDQLT